MNASAFQSEHKYVFLWKKKCVETPNFVYVFEFKLDGTAEEALRQINEKGYAREYEADQRKLYRIGVVFSSETGTIADWLAE